MKVRISVLGPMQKRPSPPSPDRQGGVFTGNRQRPAGPARAAFVGLKGRFCQHWPAACDLVGANVAGPERAVQRALFEWARHGERPFQGRRAAGAL